MQAILTRYIIRTVVASALLVLLVLVGLNAMFSFLGEIGDTGEGDYTVGLAALFVMLEIPASMYMLFPAAVAIGGVLALGGMAANSELIVMRAAGVSIRRIIGQVMQGGIILLVGIVLVGEFVAPTSQNHAERMRAAAIAGQSTADAVRGVWARDGDRYIHVGTVLPGRIVEDVTVYEFDGTMLRQAFAAERARFTGEDWLLEGVERTELNGDDLRVLHIDSMRLARLLEPELFHVLALSPETLPGWRLYRFVEYLRSNDLEADRFELALWRKVTTPLSTLVMLLLALPVVFGSMRSTGAGQRVFLGSLVGIGYYLVSELFAHVSIVYGLAVPVAALAPIILFTIGSMIALRRMLWN